MMVAWVGVGGAWIWAIMERRSQPDVMAALAVGCERTEEQQRCLQEGVEKREPSDTVDGNVNWCSHCGKQCGSSFKNRVGSCSPTPGYIFRRDENSNSKRYNHPNVQTGSIYSSQGMEAS